ADERVAAHHRHHEVTQDHVGPQLERHFQSLTAVEGRRHPVIWRETIGQEPAHLYVVLEHENERLAATADRDGRLAAWSQLCHGMLQNGIAGCSSPLVRRGGSSRYPYRGSLARERQLHSKQGAAVGAVPDLDTSAVALD